MGHGCCKGCCSSTPYGTLFSVSLTVVGLIGFLYSGAHGVILTRGFNLLADRTAILAFALAVIGGSTFIALLLICILSYCATGYVRGEIHHPIIKCCVGGVCSILIMGITLLYTFVWILLGVALSVILALYLELFFGCPQFQIVTNSGNFNQCFTISHKNDTLQVCKEGFDDLCVEGKRLGLSLSISLAFSLIITVGLIFTALMQSANYVSVRETKMRSYRP